MYADVRSVARFPMYNLPGHRNIQHYSNHAIKNVIRYHLTRIDGTQLLHTAALVGKLINIINEHCSIHCGMNCG